MELQILMVILDTDFPTIDEDSPYELSAKEKEVVEKLVKSFKNSEKLQKHINFLYTKGSIYKIYNQNLLIHGCVPMNDLGELVEVEFENKKLKGKEYLDYIDEIARKAFYLDEGEEKTNAMDFMWYLWCGKYSPIFCKNAMKNQNIDIVGDVVALTGIKYIFKKLFALNSTNALPEGKY